jgi:hypothetical protein
MFRLTRPEDDNLISINNIGRFIKTYAKSDNWHNLNIIKGNLGYGWIHYGIIRICEFSDILIIGSKFGFVPAICALACKHNARGNVSFVDANYDMNSDTKSTAWGGVGFWGKINISKHFNKFYLEDYIKTSILTTEQYVSQNKNKFWNYIYLDGDHSYLGAKNDFNLLWPRLKKNGYMSLHDINISTQDGTKYGVKKLWNELKKTNTYNMIEFTGKYGLGLIQK